MSSRSLSQRRREKMHTSVADAAKECHLRLNAPSETGNSFPERKKKLLRPLDRVKETRRRVTLLPMHALRRHFKTTKNYIRT